MVYFLCKSGYCLQNRFNQTGIFS
ncbi:MAG: hypothetical protein EPN39_14680 [Chitinophagaceae bacterium]|nr:MAG: hypothetical protein EPN39_14680 [Chitinophagaceae bacterium]